MSDEQQTVIIIDDHRLSRLVIRNDLLDNSRIKIVGEAATGEQGISLVKRRKPDFVVLDYHLADMDGLSVLNEIKLASEHTKVIFITASENAELLRELFTTDAHAVMTKRSFNTLQDVIYIINAGKRYFPPDHVDAAFNNKSEL